jgi:hypothetical protein
MLEGHPLSAVRDCLFNILAATLHIWRPSPPSATWGRAMPWWQGTHVTWQQVAERPINVNCTPLVANFIELEARHEDFLKTDTVVTNNSDYTPLKMIHRICATTHGRKVKQYLSNGNVAVFRFVELRYWNHKTHFNGLKQLPFVSHLNGRQCFPKIGLINVCSRLRETVK